jgi:two-component sensor histidine kinase
VLNYNHKTIIASVKAYNAQYDTLQTFFPGAEGLTLWPYPEYVEIMLGSNEFIQRDKVKFRYRLIGISDNWSYTNGEREIKYFKLPPGKYVFEVQIWLPGGYFGEKAQLFLVVRTPFYETRLFLAFLVMLCLLLAHQVYLFRVRRVLKEQEIRRQIADDLHDDIGNKLNIISILTQKVVRFNHPTNEEAHNNALQRLLGVTREALVSLHTMIWTVDPNKDKISDLLTRMEDFAEDYLKPLNISSSFRFPAAIPEREINLKMRHHLILIYQELLTNMIKHSPPAQVTFHIALSETGRFELEIWNEHSKKAGEYATISAHRGLESLKRRLQQVDGTLQHLELAENLQKTTLVVFNIYRT